MYNTKKKPCTYNIWTRGLHIYILFNIIMYLLSRHFVKKNSTDR